MILKGKVFKFGNNINTDWIISGRYKFAITNMKELAQYLFEDIRPNFYKEIIPGKSIIIAGHNFGMGSSREQAPWVIKEAGISCVVACSFARIFYRNSFNIGLPLIEAETKSLKENDFISVDLNKGMIKREKPAISITFNPYDTFRKELIRRGGILNYLATHSDLKL
jgi:3-isopropylmalate/(R)-2-methylmalate dehydratase small subunit